MQDKQGKLDLIRTLHKHIKESEEDIEESQGNIEKQLRQSYLSILNQAVNIGVDCLSAREEETLEKSTLKEIQKFQKYLAAIEKPQLNQKVTSKSIPTEHTRDASFCVATKKFIIDFFIKQIYDHCATHNSTENKKLVLQLKKIKPTRVDPQVFFDSYGKIYLDTLPDDLRATGEMYLTWLIEKATTYHSLTSLVTKVHDFCTIAAKLHQTKPSSKPSSAKPLILEIKLKRQNIHNLNLIIDNFLQEITKEIKQYRKNIKSIENEISAINPNQIDEETFKKIKQKYESIIRKINQFQQELSGIQNKIRGFINTASIQKTIITELNSDKKEIKKFATEFAQLTVLHIQEESTEIQTALDTLEKHIQTLNDLIDDAPKSEASDSTSIKSRTNLKEKSKEKSTASSSTTPLQKNSFAQISTQLKATASPPQAAIPFFSTMAVSNAPRSNKAFQNPQIPSALKALGFYSDTEMGGDGDDAYVSYFDESLDMSPDEEEKKTEAPTGQPSRFFF